MDIQTLNHELAPELRLFTYRLRQSAIRAAFKLTAASVLAGTMGVFVYLAAIALGLPGSGVTSTSPDIASFSPASPPSPGASLGAAASSAAQFVFGSTARLQGEDQNRINVLVMGMSGPPNPAPYLTDTLLLVSIEPSSGKVALVSIPRDLLVESPFGHYGTKINSLYEYGKLRTPDQPARYSVQKVEALSGLTIPYWIAFDLDVVKDIVNGFHGIDVVVDQPIYDPAFPGPNYSYETFSLAAGFQHLDGATASKYVRSRHSEFGDFDRVKRQRQVLEALAQKVRDLNVLWGFPTLVQLFQNLKAHIATNMDIGYAKRFYQLLKNTTGKDIYDMTLSASPATGVLRESTSGGAYVLVPKAGFEHYSEIQAMFQNIFGKF